MTIRGGSAEPAGDTAVERTLPAEPLAPKPRQALLAIADHWRNNGYGPSMRDLKRALELSSTSVAFYWVTKLIALGLVEDFSRKARSIRPTPQGWAVLGWTSSAAERLAIAEELLWAWVGSEGDFEDVIKQTEAFLAPTQD